MKYLLADTGYSSGENYHLLEKHGIEAYIPVHGTYKREREGFVYDQQEDVWICSQGKKATFRSYSLGDTGSLKKKYYTRRSDCKGCPIAAACIGKQHEKKIEVTAYRTQYERMIEKLNSSKGQYLKKKRQCTVEPVLGTLINFTGLKKVNTRGINLAHKVFLLSAASYNLKKYLNYIRRKRMAMALALQQALNEPMLIFYRLYF